MTQQSKWIVGVHWSISVAPEDWALLETLRSLDLSDNDNVVDTDTLYTTSTPRCCLLTPLDLFTYFINVATLPPQVSAVHGLHF